MSNKICDKVIRKEERHDAGYIYSYELTQREGYTTVDYGVNLYSIKVKMTDSEGRTRKSEAKDVFSCKKRALAFFDKIVRNLATPIDLKYIIEDEMTI